MTPSWMSSAVTSMPLVDTFSSRSRRRSVAGVKEEPLATGLDERADPTPPDLYGRTWCGAEERDGDVRRSGVGLGLGAKFSRYHGDRRARDDQRPPFRKHHSTLPG